MTNRVKEYLSKKQHSGFPKAEAWINRKMPIIQRRFPRVDPVRVSTSFCEGFILRKALAPILVPVKIAAAVGFAQMFSRKREARVKSP